MHLQSKTLREVQPDADVKPCFNQAKRLRMHCLRHASDSACEGPTRLNLLHLPTFNWKPEWRQVPLQTSYLIPACHKPYENSVPGHIGCQLVPVVFRCLASLHLASFETTTARYSEYPEILLISRNIVNYVQGVLNFMLRKPHFVQDISVCNMAIWCENNTKTICNSS